MEEKKGFSKKLNAFFAGKGFYIVLFLCAAVIGVSAWMMAAGDVAMKNEVPVRSNVNMENKRVETVIIPAETAAPAAEAPVFGEAEPVTGGDEEIAAEAPEISAEGINAPVSEPEGLYSVDTLSYDVTMRDWRTHDGLDVMAELGSTVVAAREGTVESIEADALYGTVLTIDHGDGIKTVYANLADVPAVNVGDWVEAGATIGSVGTTAICEIGQGTHLHFAVTVNGVYADPLEYLPA